MKAEVLNSFDPEVLKAILTIERDSFPESWRYDDAEEYYRHKLNMEANINILLTENEQMVGYLLAMPHNDAVQELKEDDPDLKEDPMKYYIETVAVLPEFRRRKGLATMLYKLAEECHKRGTDKVSIHARVSNRLSEIIQNNYRVIEVRRIERWKYYNCEEPADYIEIILTTVGLEAPS